MTTTAVPTGRRRPLHLGALAAVAVVVYAATLALGHAVTPADRAALGEAFGPGWDSGLNGLLLLGLALVVLWRVPRHPVGVVMALFGLFWVLVGLADAYAAWGLRAELRTAGAAGPATWVAVWFTARFGSFLPVGIALLLFLYPDGRLLGGRWGVASRAALAAMLAWATAVTLLPGGPVDDRSGAVDLDRATLPLPGAVADVVVPVLTVAAVLGGLVAVATVAVRHRRARGPERSRLRWLLWAALADVVLVVLATVLAGDRLGLVVFAVVVVLPAAAVTVGLVRPDLVPVDDLLSWTLVHGSTAVAVVLVELAVLAAVDSLVGPVDQRSLLLLVLAVATGTYWPLRHLLVGRVRRLVFGTRDDPYDAVAGLASRLESVGEVTGQLVAVADAVARAFGVAYVRVEVDRPGGERMTATHGLEPAATRALPITFRDDVVGRIVLPRDGLRARLSRRDEALLGDLVRQAAVAARTARLAEQLQDNRERLVLAREEERRRIRRDLHDGLGPALSGVVFRLESARLVLPDDPQAADRGLEVVRTQVQDAIADVRRLVHDLRPPALDDLGLVGALRQQAAALATPGFEVRLDAGDGLGDLPAAVEVAAYRVVGEAVTNAARHARASRCDVLLRVADGRLCLEVRDDGVGVPAGAVAGVGLVSLRERVAELGGDAEVSCPPEGGTTVRAGLPLRSAP